VLSRLYERVSGLAISILCEESQIERASFWERSRSFWARPGVTHISGVLPGVRWPLSLDGDLLRWVSALGDIEDVRRADLVLSDNLAGVLEHRPDAMLLGSFLWSDVLAAAYPDSSTAQAFVEHERALLAKHRPSMLCVGDIAMPGVLERTHAVALPWMCEHDRVTATPPSRPRIMVIGGATGAADGMLARIVRALVAHGGWDVASPPHLGAPIAFDFGPEELASATLVVCRPGVGTITDCVAQHVPMLLVRESESNVELSFNAKRLGELGIGRDLGTQPEDRAVVIAVEETLERLSPMRQRMATVQRNGLHSAVDELAKHLDRAGAQ
jgi:hypothetical protein